MPLKKNVSFPSASMVSLPPPAERNELHRALEKMLPRRPRGLENGHWREAELQPLQFRADQLNRITT